MPVCASKELRNTVRAAITRLRGGEPAQDLPGRFIPHVSIAYCHKTGPAQPLIARVEQLRELDVVNTPVAAIQLVDMWREGRTYRWRDLAVISLGTAAGA